MQSGWINNNGVWYYADQSGGMQTGLVTINNNTYYLNEFGAMQTGNITVNGVKYTFAATGEKINSTTANTTTNNSNAANNSDKDISTSGDLAVAQVVDQLIHLNYLVVHHIQIYMDVGL